MATQEFDPIDPRKQALHALIYDEIVKGMDGNTLMIRMMQVCGENGSRCLDWLKMTLDPKDTATGLMTLMAILTEDLGDDVVKGVQMKIDLNNTLTANIKLSQQVFAAVVLTKIEDAGEASPPP